MNILSLDHAISDKERAELLFQGEVLIYRNIKAMQALISYSDTLLRKHLDGADPVSAQQHFAPDVFLERMGKAQTIFRQSKEPKDLFFAVLEACGMDLAQAFYDHFPMRVVPYGETHNGAHRAAIGHHRDTWGSNIHSQMNWWAPIYALESERTIAIYPAYWDQSIANNTATWRFENYLQARKQVSPERKSSYPSAPRPTQAVDESCLVKLLMNPGDVLNFSSAHLHASVPNTTQAARFSVEMRTIHQDDIIFGREAPNVDNAGKEPMHQWFKSIIDKRTSLESVLNRSNEG